MSERFEDSMERWTQAVLRGEPQAVARAISAVENQDDHSRELLRRLFPHTGRALRIGVTGAAGSGKSTLVDGLAAQLRRQGKTVGILAVDPSSPFTGGAILGDRIRMSSLSGDPGVTIRSMATRGALGGLSRAVLDAALVLDAAGKDCILIETVGVGQDEVAVAKLADVTLLLLVPGLGDDVQTFKAGVMEIADIFVVNKADLPGADRVVEETLALLSLVPSDGWTPPVVKTVAARKEGLEELLAAVERYMEFSRSSGSRETRQAEHWQARLLELLRDRLLEGVFERVLADGDLARHAAAVASRQQDPYTVADQILEKAGWRAKKS